MKLNGFYTFFYEEKVMGHTSSAVIIQFETKLTLCLHFWPETQIS